MSYSRLVDKVDPKPSVLNAPFYDSITVQPTKTSSKINTSVLCHVPAALVVGATKRWAISFQFGVPESSEQL